MYEMEKRVPSSYPKFSKARLEEAKDNEKENL